MKKLLLLYPVLVLLFGFSLGHIADRSIKDILNRIQLSEDDAENMIFSNSSAVSFYYPNPKELKALSAGEKSALVPILGEYIKSYTKSEQFRRKYLEYREMRKPIEPEAPQSANSLKEQQKVQLAEGIENMKKVKGSMPADQQSIFDESIKELEAQLKSLEDPNNNLYGEEMDNIFKESYQQQMEEYKKRVADWEKEYPMNPDPMIRKWLENFMEISKDVDYSAQTKSNSEGKNIFVNSDYESKHYLWKLCYRSGKETVDAGRAFAGAWLSELK